MSEKNRDDVVSVLQDTLLALVSLSIAIREAHWNVRGMNFYAIHTMLGKFYEAADEFVDEVAERMMQLGGQAQASTVISNTSTRDTTELLARLHAQASGLSKSSVLAAEQAMKSGDVGTADLLTRLTEALDKQIWFIEATLS